MGNVKNSFFGLVQLQWHSASELFFRMFVFRNELPEEAASAELRHVCYRGRRGQPHGTVCGLSRVLVRSRGPRVLALRDARKPRGQGQTRVLEFLKTRAASPQTHSRTLIMPARSLAKTAIARTPRCTRFDGAPLHRARARARERGRVQKAGANQRLRV